MSGLHLTGIARVRAPARVPRVPAHGRARGRHGRPAPLGTTRPWALP